MIPKKVARENETLSSKITRRGNITAENVKEFIQEDVIKIIEEGTNRWVMIKKIKERAGEELLIPVSLTPLGSANHSPQTKSLTEDIMRDGNRSSVKLSEGLNKTEDTSQYLGTRNYLRKSEDTLRGCGKWYKRKGYMWKCGEHYHGNIKLCPVCSLRPTRSGEEDE